MGDKKNLILNSHLSRSLYFTSFFNFFKHLSYSTEHNTYNKRRSISFLPN